MMKKSSSLENKPCCSKGCKKNTDNLNSKITELSDKLNDKLNRIYHYSLDDTVTDYSRPSPTIESSPDDAQNKNPSTENGESTDSILSKPAVKFVKAAERSTSNKVEAVKKTSMRYAELYRKPSKKPTITGNQRNWNNLKSQQLGENFVRKNKACFNCGHFNHLAYDCGLGVKKGRACPTYTHKSMPPRPSTHRPDRPTIRPNINSTRPNKPAHSYGRRPF
nr:retrotransposon Orf1 [Tanacetum cinerariifolium]